jgi:hypothetical protein
MQLDPKSVIAKIFLFCHEISRRFAGDEWYARPHRTDICQLVRMVFLWAPLTIATHVAVVAAVVFATIYHPARVFGWGYGWFWLVVGVYAVVISGVILIIKGYRTVKINMPQALKEIGAIATAGYGGFKGKFCPIIEFRGDV